MKTSTDSALLQDQFNAGQWLLFQNPVAVVKTRHLPEVMDCLKAVEAKTRQGYYAAGFLSYEAASAMDHAFLTYKGDDFPLIWFGIYKTPEALAQPAQAKGNFELNEWRPNISLAAYHEAIAKIKDYIAAGATYQVNYTLRLRNRFCGDAYAYFLSLYDRQRAGYCAYLALDRYRVCSVSPELFFALHNGEMICKPMKGTIKRGLTPLEDAQNQAWLAASEKDRAENVMIVDMIRNDMSRIAEMGSVEVEKLFSIEAYPTVLQMTSTVKAKTHQPISTIMANMFPCASITGAPKVKTMEIIKQLESELRGLYTGAIGYIAPDGRAQFSVAIRTVVIDIEAQAATYGVGSGIVWDSDAGREYEECQTKAVVLDASI